jgi:hypothetical protein
MIIKDVKERGRVLFESIIPAVNWRDYETEPVARSVCL